MDYSRSEVKQWAQKNLRGFYDAPFTPFTSDGQIDEAGLRRNIEILINDVGIDGMCIGGFLAEAWNLKLSDWFRYHEIYADAVKGRVDLSTIILDPSVHQALEKLEFVEKLGFNSAEIMNPSVQLKTDDEIFSFYKYISEHSDLAVVLYRTPVSGTVLSMEVMKRLSELDTLVGVKQASLKRSDTIKLRRDLRDDFSVFEPFEYFWLDDLQSGYPVTSWAAFVYTLYGKRRGELKEYIRLGEEGKWAEARTVWEGLRPCGNLIDDMGAEIIAKTQSYASGFTIFKPWYDAIGLTGGHVLAPVFDVSQAAREELIEKLTDVGIC
jgi:4-hydroxy-tetrahydrodipicolinate synthase